MVAATESAILDRVFKPSRGDLPPNVARYVLKLDFSRADHRRIAELSEKAQDGTLSNEEQAELDRYLSINDLLMIMQSKARLSLKKPRSAK